MSEASKATNTQVFVGELGWMLLQIWKLSFIVCPPLSPPSLSQISVAGMNALSVSLPSLFNAHVSSTHTHNGCGLFTCHSDPAAVLPLHQGQEHKPLGLP